MRFYYENYFTQEEQADFVRREIAKELKLGDASLVHDVLCQFAKELPIFDAKPPSDLFYRMLLDAGFSKFRAAVYRAAVLNFGPQDWGDLYLSRHA